MLPGIAIFRNRRTDPSLALIGTISKGDPKVLRGKVEVFGPDLENKFRFEPVKASQERTEAIKVAAIASLGSLYPTTIKFYLNGDTPEECFQSGFAEYNTLGRMLVACDGSRIRSRHNAEIVRTVPANEPCRNDTPARIYCDKCSPIGKLKMLIPDLMRLPDMFGEVHAQTHSLIDIETISARLDTFFRMRDSRGFTLRNLPLLMFRVQREAIGVDRRQQVKKDGRSIDNPNFLKSFKGKKWFMEITIDNTQTNIAALTGDASPLLGAAPQRPAISPAETEPHYNAPTPVTLAQAELDRFIHFCDNASTLAQYDKLYERVYSPEKWNVLTVLPNIETLVSQKLEEVRTRVKSQLNPAKKQADSPESAIEVPAQDVTTEDIPL